MEEIRRKQTKAVHIGNLTIGGNHDIVIQSMCNTDTRDVKSTVNQILELEKAGCEMVRVAVPDMIAAEAVGEIKKNIMAKDDNMDLIIEIMSHPINY